MVYKAGTFRATQVPVAVCRPPSLPGSNAPGITRDRTLAAIDLGTNNCRLLIARQHGSELVVIDAFSRIVRLGEGLLGTGRISDDAIDRTVAALGICASKLQRRRVHLSRAVATEACRRASNGDELVRRVRAETGIALDIIAPAEEAGLAVLGCHSLLEPGEGPAVIFDIGGGSTEVMVVGVTGGKPQLLEWTSIPWGVVSLTEHVAAHPATADSRCAAYAVMRGTITTCLRDFERRIAAFRVQDGPLRLLGTSGTVTTLASVFLDLPRYDRNMVDGALVPASALRTICKRLTDASLDERSAMQCIGRDRADLVVAGCAILESIIDIWPAQQVGVADRGIREGILRRLARLDSATVHRPCAAQSANLKAVRP